jgi:pyruvate dehydrogenase E1 component
MSREHLDTLDTIQKRVLWLATRMIHHANSIRPNPDGTKVGGHQASSASMVTLMTALYFHFLEAGDRVSVKPHASPVFHAIHYLLGQLPRDYLTQLRAYKGLQAYPSRTKDVTGVDFSTGSVGLGAVAPAFAALAHRYAKDHFGEVTSNRFVGILGDAEMDEGNVWEAILDQSLNGLGNLLWIVDLNRQSLDRVVPGIRAAQLKAVFEESGWQVLDVKYGRVLQSLFARPGGSVLRQRIDEMSNEEYQALIRLPGDKLRGHLVQMNGKEQPDITAVIKDIADDDLPAAISNLGGHDLEELLSSLAKVDEAPDQPTILFAYTIKGWGLPIAGHPLNHSMLLSQEEIDALRVDLDLPADDEWADFALDSKEGQLCKTVAARLFPEIKPTPALLQSKDLPSVLPIAKSDKVSTQQTFGRLLMAISREPKLAARIVTASPDVSVSTNLSGWLGKMGVYAPEERLDYEDRISDQSGWNEGPAGQHIELGISEMNLFMLLGMFGLSAELIGQQLIPIGTVYDPFVLRGLDALVYGLYSESRFIFAGTPAGITLAPEGGAHQSTITPSVGAELPNLNAFEPCFAQELAWLFLDALHDCLDVENGRATYLRLSTRPIEQKLFQEALNRLGEERLRHQVLAGGYRLVDWRSAETVVHKEYLVHIATSGALVPEAVEAAKLLLEEGIAVNVLNLTSPRRLFEAWQQSTWAAGSEMTDASDANEDPFSWLIPLTERHAPIITVHDGASHALAWLGSVFGTLVVPLGVDRFGQSGYRDDLYRHYGVDAASIVEAALTALNRSGLS